MYSDQFVIIRQEFLSEWVTFCRSLFLIARDRSAPTNHRHSAISCSKTQWRFSTLAPVLTSKGSRIIWLHRTLSLLSPSSNTLNPSNVPGSTAPYPPSVFWLQRPHSPLFPGTNAPYLPASRGSNASYSPLCHWFDPAHLTIWYLLDSTNSTRLRILAPTHIKTQCPKLERQLSPGSNAPYALCPLAPIRPTPHCNLAPTLLTPNVPWPHAPSNLVSSSPGLVLPLICSDQPSLIPQWRDVSSPCLPTLSSEFFPLSDVILMFLLSLQCKYT